MIIVLIVDMIRGFFSLLYYHLVYCIESDPFGETRYHALILAYWTWRPSRLGTRGQVTPGAAGSIASLHTFHVAVFAVVL